MIKKIAIVVPTIREENTRRFLNEWKTEFDAHPNLSLFIVEDNPTKSFSLARANIRHVSWRDIEAALGEKSWIIPRRTDCVRNFGYYLAWKDSADVLITLDDDCYPARRTPYLIDAFVRNLDRTVSAAYLNTLDGRVTNQRGLYPRGFPYAGRGQHVALCHGLWENIPDFDGKTQLVMPDVRVSIADTEASVVPHGVLFPMCGMNVAVRRDMIPAFYFPLMGEDANGRSWGVSRFGDIWAGLFVKKIIDHLGLAAVSGEPVIHHDRASSPEKNMELEKAGLPLNEILYRDIERVILTETTPVGCYRELAEKLPAAHPYFKTLTKAMREWAELFA